MDDNSGSIDDRLEPAGAELVKQILDTDTDRRRLIKETEDLKALRNRASEAIGQAKRKGEDASAEMAKMREVADRVKALDAELKTVDERVEELLAQVPNLPHPSVPAGTSVIRLLPALNLSRGEAEEGLRIVEQLIVDLAKKKE